MPNYYCCVPGCTAAVAKQKNLEKNPWMAGVKFFTFPKDKIQHNRWVQLVRNENLKMSRWTTVCSRHFVDQAPTDRNPDPSLFPHNNWGDKLIQDTRGTSLETSKKTSAENKKKPVTKSYIPVKLPGKIALPVPVRPATQEVDVSVPVQSEPDVPVQTLELKDTVESEVTIKTSELPIPVESPVPQAQRNSAKGEQSINPAVYDHNYSLNHKPGPVQTCSIETQTDLDMEDILNMENSAKSELGQLLQDQLLKDDETAHYCTGIPSLKIIKGLYDIVSPYASQAKYWTGPDSANTKNYEEEGRKKPGPSRKLPMFTEFLITLMWLRLGLPVGFLSLCFGVAKSSMHSILTTWVHIIHQVITPQLLRWPTREEIYATMPDVFKNGKFDFTRIIIDCTEFFITKPHQPDAQYQTYSSYKHHNTLKVLVGMAPNGLITFVSKVWSGNCSDKHLTKESHLLDLLERGDYVMADRGFQIEDILLALGVKLIAPPFTRPDGEGGKRLNASEIDETKEIAGVRIHVERAIGRMKNWKILTRTNPCQLSSLMTEITQVIAGFCNLQPDLVK